MLFVHRAVHGTWCVLTCPTTRHSLTSIPPGPCRVNDAHNVTFNPHSWNEKANIFFIDQPIGVGFSYADHGEYVVSPHAFLSSRYRIFDPTPESDRGGCQGYRRFCCYIFRALHHLQGSPLPHGGRILCRKSSSMHAKHEVLSYTANRDAISRCTLLLSMTKMPN